MAVILVAADRPASSVPMDPANPTCPASPNFSSYREMHLTVREFDGRSVLLAEGEIDDNLGPRLRAALANGRIEEIWLRSPGGNYYAGTEAGRIIREHGVPTRIPAGWVCHSVCAFMFMGGAERFVDTGGYFMLPVGPGVFSGGSTANVSSELLDQAAVEAARMATEDIDYLIRMGVSRTLLREVMYGGSLRGPSRRCLTPEELGRYHVVTR